MDLVQHSRIVKMLDKQGRETEEPAKAEALVTQGDDGFFYNFYRSKGDFTTDDIVGVH